MANVETPASLPADCLEEFEATACRPLPLRQRYAFIHTYKPVLAKPTRALTPFTT